MCISASSSCRALTYVHTHTDRKSNGYKGRARVSVAEGSGFCTRILYTLQILQRIYMRAPTQHTIHVRTLSGIRVTLFAFLAHDVVCTLLICFTSTTATYIQSIYTNQQQQQHTVFTQCANIACVCVNGSMCVCDLG